jgi:DNA repair protein RadA/Sms
MDCFLNLAGGLRFSDPGLDLAMLAALVSSITDTPIPASTLIFGEVGL